MNMDTAARPALRPDLAHRPLLPLRPGHEGAEGLRPGLRAGRERQGPDLPHDLPLDRRRSRRRLGLLHRSAGDILRYRYDRDAIEVVPATTCKKDYFGLYDPDLARPHGLQLAAGRLGSAAEHDLRRARQLRLPVPLRSPGRTRRGARPHHLAALAAQRHVRPVQLRLPRLHPRARRPDALLPDRRADLRRRQAGRRQGQDGHGRVQGHREPAPGHLRHPHRPLHRPRADLLRRRRSGPRTSTRSPSARTAPSTRCRGSRRTARREPT